MKIVLFTDPHLGLKLPHSRVSADQTTSDRLEDVAAIFQQIGDLATRVGAKQIFCLGDLFDKAHPTAPVLIRAARELVKLTAPDKHGVPSRELFVLPGNHDAHGKSGDMYSLDMYTELEVPGLTIMKHGMPIRSSGSSIRFHPVPWCPTKQFRERVQDCRQWIRSGGVSHDILLMHQTIKGCKDGTWVAKRGVDGDTLGDFDLVLSGHIHEPQEFSNGRYLGSPLQLRMTDAGSIRGAWVLDTNSLIMQHAPLKYPEFVRWSFADTDKLSVFESMKAELPSLLDELDEILFSGRDVYLDVKIEGERESVTKVAGIVRAHADQRKEARIESGVIRSAKIIAAPYALIEPSERMGVVADIAEKGKVATPDDLVRAFVRVQTPTLPGDATPDMFEAMGRNILVEANALAGSTMSSSFVEFASVSFESFGVFSPKQTVELLEVGQVIVLGDNQDTDAANSNGSGKTTIFKALSWVLFGRTIDGLTTNVCHIGDKKAVVSSVFIIEDTQYKVTRKRTPKTGGLQLLEWVGEGYEDKSLRASKDTQQAIEVLLGLDWDAFRCTVLFGQGDNRRFAAPGLTDAARKSVLSTILRLGVYEVAKKRAAELRKSFDAQADAHARDISDAEDSIVLVNTARAKVVGRRDATIEVRDGGAATLDTLYQLCKAERTELAKLRTEVAELTVTAQHAKNDHEEVDELCKSTDTLRRKRRVAVGAARTAVSALATEGPCGECGAPREYDRDAHSAAEKRLNVASDNELEARNLLEAFSQEEDETRAHKGKCERELRVATRELDSLRVKLASTKERIEDLKAAKERADKRIVDCNVQIAEYNDEIKDFDVDIICSQRGESLNRMEATIAKWWVHGFGSKGIPAYAIEQALPVLNRHANRHLAALTDGDIVIRWSPTKKGSSGVIKEELSMSITIEGTDDPAPSGGQYKKIELATEVALGDTMSDREGSATNLIVFDEVFDGLDHEGRSRVLAWLGTLPQESQFVVSHRSDVADDFEAVLLVTKRNGHATLEVYE